MQDSSNFMICHCHFQSASFSFWSRISLYEFGWGCGDVWRHLSWNAYLYIYTLGASHFTWLWLPKVSCCIAATIIRPHVFGPTVAEASILMQCVAGIKKIIYSYIICKQFQLFIKLVLWLVATCNLLSLDIKDIEDRTHLGGHLNINMPPLWKSHCGDMPIT